MNLFEQFVRDRMRMPMQGGRARWSQWRRALEKQSWSDDLRRNAMRKERH
jgi:hypothetical protein